MKRDDYMKKSSNKDYIYIFTLILLFLVIIFSIVGLKYVNGSTVDWDSQHVIFPEYFRNLFYKTHDLFPSFAFNIGAGENIYNFSYYGLLSPMVLISYIFPFIKMIDFIQIYMILLVIISIVLMYFWLRKRFDTKLSIIGTILFLLASPIIYHTHRHLMFINYMPFLIMGLYGVDSYFDKNKKSLLIISIFLIIMSSYYYSVGSIIAIVLYALYKYMEINKKITFKSFIIDGLKFIFPIIIAILMSCVLLLPTAYTLLNGRADITSSVDIMKLLIPKFNLSEILYNSYTIGVTSIFILAIIYGYTIKEKNYKFLSIVFSILILFPIIIYLLSGFMYVRGKVLIPLLPIAILLITTFIDKLKYEKNKVFNILILVVSIIEIYIYITTNKPILILEVIAILIGYLITLKFKNKNYLIYITCVSALICCLASNYSETLVTKEDIKLQYNTSNYDKLNVLLEEDENIYRIANNIMEMKNLNRVVNTNYYLPSIYSSLENQYYYDFATKSISNEMENRISTAISSTKNILFNTYIGSKYMISDNVPIGYKNIENSDIYVNDKVLPIGYSTTKVLDKETYNTLEYPEKAYALLTNIIVDNSDNVDYKNVIKEETLKYTEEHKNIQIEKNGDNYIINSEDNGKLILTLDKTYKNKILFITFDMNYSERCGIGDTSITINNVKNTLSCRTWTYHNKNYKFEYSISSEEIKELNIEFTKGKYNISNIKVYSLDYSKITDFVDSVDVFKINKEKTIGDTIEGEINVNANGYFILTIPYEEKGFTIYLDNKIIEYEKVDDTFIGFPINEGHHDIKIVYTAPYLPEGMVVSIVGYLIFLPIIYSDIFKKKKK